MTGSEVQKLSIQRNFAASHGEASSKRIVIDSFTRDYRRGANDLCVYVLKPGDSSKRMVVVNMAGSWKEFLDSIGEKLKVNVVRVFNKRDEIKKLSDLSQGDILAIQHGSERAPSPKEHASNLQQNTSMHWAKLCRLVTLQCLDEYVVTEVIKVGKHHETLKARRKQDQLPVIIKRIASSTKLKVSTLRSYILLCCSIRHPRIVNYLDVFISQDTKRPPGMAKGKRRHLPDKVGILTIVMERYDASLEAHFEQRLKLQKPLTSHEIVDVISQILHILHHLHSDLRTVHRNLKMSNCLLDKKGNLFLADFSLPAVNPSTNTFHMRYFCQNSVAQRKGLLTPGSMYCSPEAFSTGRTSEKDDIWALGCIITELVTHKSVVDRTSGEIFGRSLGAIAQAVAEVECKDSALGSLCRIFLEPEPAKRPTAFEILWRHMRTVYPEAQRPALPLTLSVHDSSMTSMLSRSNDIPTLINALLKIEFSAGMEAAAMRLNEILHSEPSKRSSMRDVFATPVGRMTGLNALTTCLLKGSPLAQQLAASALRTSTLDDENEKAFVSDDVTVLVSAVLMGNPPTQAHAAAVLSNICCNHSNMREALHLADGVSALTALISCGMLNTCLLEAASAIRNACINHEGNRNDFMKAGGVGALIRILQSEFVGQPIHNTRAIITLENVIGALRNCCNQHNGNCMDLAKAEGIPMVVRLIPGAPLNIQEQIAGLIRNSCIGYFENKNHMARCGAYWSFVQMLHQPALTSTLKEEIVSAIRYSTIGHKSNRNLLGESGLIRALVNILTSGPFEGSMRAKEEAAAALRIACDGSESNSAELFKSLGIQALMDIISAPLSSKIAQEEALSAAANACSHFAANVDILIDQPQRYHIFKAMSQSADVTDDAKFYAKCLLILIDQRKCRTSPDSVKVMQDLASTYCHSGSLPESSREGSLGRANEILFREEISWGTLHKHGHNGKKLSNSKFPSASSLPRLTSTNMLDYVGMVHWPSSGGPANEQVYEDQGEVHAPAARRRLVPRHHSSQQQLHNLPRRRRAGSREELAIDHRWPYVAGRQEAREAEGKEVRARCYVPLVVSASPCPCVKYPILVTSVSKSLSPHTSLGSDENKLERVSGAARPDAPPAQGDNSVT